MSHSDQLITDHIDVWTSAILAKSTSGRGSNKKYELYGIKKLRELILELAVRGKLVPQDPNDEPASVLLEKIATEKAMLVKEGKIKKPKPLAKIDEDEKCFDLPLGWEWCKLGDIVSYGNPLKAEANTVKPTTWILELEDIEKGTSRLLNKIRFSERQFKSTKNVFSENDVLYGKLRPYLDKVLVADESGVCTTEIIPITCHDKLLPQYLRYFLKSPNFIEYANSSTHGMSLPRLGTDKAINSLVFLPPTNEQHRIVAKVDELMLLCDQLEQQTEASIDAHATLVEVLLATLTDSADANELAENWARIAKHFDSLFTTEQSIELLKQTVLQLAVMGKLVPQNSEDEPASVLLERIAEEKAQLIKDKKIKKGKSLPSINDNEKPFDLPQGWEWCRLQSISSKITDGEHQTPPRISSGYRLLSAKNVRDGFLDTDNCDYISEEHYTKSRERCCPERGDILIVSVGGTIGRSSLVPDDDQFALVRSVAMIKPLLFDSSYLKYAMDSPFLQRSIHSNKRGGAQPCLYLSEISKFVFAMPPLTEQHRIVAKVDELMQICDQLKAKLQQSQIIQVQLTDALVEQALA